MWLANRTHPDVAHAVRAVARHTKSPTEVHWNTAVGILENVFFHEWCWYFFSERKWTIEMIAYADADYASTPQTGEVGVRWCCNVRGGMRVLVFVNPKVCDAFDHRSRFRPPRPST